MDNSNTIHIIHPQYHEKEKRNEKKKQQNNQKYVLICGWTWWSWHAMYTCSLCLSGIFL